MPCRCVVAITSLLLSGGDSEELTDSRSSHHHNHHDEEMDTNVPPPLPTTGGGGGRDSAGAGGDSTCVSHDSTATAHLPSVNHKSNIVNIGLTPVGPGPWDPKARARLRYFDNTPCLHDSLSYFLLQKYFKNKV